jgi:hypothetical protein
MLVVVAEGHTQSCAPRPGNEPSQQQSGSSQLQAVETSKPSTLVVVLMTAFRLLQISAPPDSMTSG